MSAKEIILTVDEPTMQNEGVRKSMISQNGGSAVEMETQARGDASYPEFRLQKPGKARPRACRPSNPPFDSRRYVEILLTFNALKNFDLKEVPVPGQYVIRASCMGKDYGHFLSRSVDIHSIALFARSDSHHNHHIPDIDIDEELFFYIRFKELVDNPLLLSLCDTTGCTTTEFDNLNPIGYICLDVAQIFELGPGIVESHIEPWVIIDPEIQKTFLTGQPMLTLTVECQTGMPTPIQLRQGNIMTVFIESMSNLPEEVIQNASDPKDAAEMQVMITLPHSDKEPFLDFVGGKLNDGSFIEPPLTTLKSLDEATQTADLPTNSVDCGRFVPTRHWASVRKNWSDLPTQAAAASTNLMPEMEDAEAVFGDAVEAHGSMGSGQGPLISWDAQHKKYITTDSYKKMLTRLSQDVIWPLEVVVTTQRPSTKKDKLHGIQSDKVHSKKKKKKLKISDDSAENDASEASISNETGEAEDSEILYMNELGRPTTSETVVVYHGIAFVDLSRLVYPGVQTVRFACRLHPFSQELLMSKTCLNTSAFAEALLGTTSLTAYESISNLGTLKDRPEPLRESSEGQMSAEGQGNQDGLFPFIVFEISLKRAIIPLYKTTSATSETVQDFIPPREIPRRKLINSGMAQQKFRRSVLEAAAEISSEYTNHYWKDVVEGRKDGQGNSRAISADELKKGFVFYLNASGRYLVLREHLRQAVSQIVQQRCLNIRPSGFQTHRDFQSYLHDMYTYLVDEIHETLSKTALQEVDPLDHTPEQSNDTCSPESTSGVHLKELEQKIILRELLFYAEESFAQGDFDNCHRLHLQRICRSKEAPQCWVDFAIMWLGRGDDRMAEIAVREALRSDPKYIHALIIGGVIAVRHNDERGIDSLSSALALTPLSPEVLVILAVSLATVNNEMASDYFFRKAAYIHRTLTGQETDTLDKGFDKISKSVGIKQSVMNIAKAEVATERPASPVLEEPSPTQVIPLLDHYSTSHETVSNKITTPRHSHHQRRKSSGARKGSDTTPRKGSDPNSRKLSHAARKMSSKEKSHHSKGSLHQTESNKMNEHPVTDGNEEPVESQEEEEEEELYTKRDSISGKAHPRKSLAYAPRFDFETDISNITVENAILPPLRPSILIPWNVTEFTDKMKAFLEAADKIHDPEHDIASDEIIKAEYDKIVQDGEDEQIAHMRSGSVVIVEEGNKRKSHLPKQSRSQPKNMIPIPSKPSQKMDENKTSNDKSRPKLPVYMNRLGSELIWTAQLLLQMRMFDMLDGVLARELYVSGSRSIQFLYLRAMSLYLRQSQHEAIPILEEAIQLDSENSVFWILKGHCHYEIGQNGEAVTCYEKALRLPVGKENRHLLYLRYGSLSMDGINSETAKKVFLHGIEKYPTPYMWLATGNTCYLMGDYDEAEASFTEANRLDNTNPITWAHLALINLAKDQQALAEQSYKWALRFGLKKGKIMDEIKRLQEEKGFGDPSFPRVPNCIPHDYYVRRLGRQKPFDIYRDALINEAPSAGKTRFQDNERETELKRRLQEKADCGKPKAEPAEGVEVMEKGTDLEPAEAETNVAAEANDNEVTIEVTGSQPASENNSKVIQLQTAKSNVSSKQLNPKLLSPKPSGKGSGRKSVDQKGNGRKSVDQKPRRPRKSNPRPNANPDASAGNVDKQISRTEKKRSQKSDVHTK